MFLGGMCIDHNLSLPTYFASEETTTLDPIFWNDDNGIESKVSLRSHCEHGADNASSFL
jgi:hypothetical protein